MGKGGRKSKYDPETTPAKAEELAKDLLTDAQIAAQLGITYETFRQWSHKYVAFSVAVKRGKQEANRDLVDVMKKSAKGYFVEEEETVVYLDRDKQPKSYSKVIKKRYIPPSTTTQIFLAKNRMPEDFRDVHRQEVNMSGQLQVSTLADLMLEEFKKDGTNEEAEEASEDTDLAANTSD